MEEFSFPTVAGGPVSALHLPPSSLWYFHSPEFLHHSFSEGGANIATTCSRALRRPSSPAGLSDCGEEYCSGAALEFHERMDLLWEDFNEELFRGSLDGGRAAPPEKSSRRRSSSSSSSSSLGNVGLAVVAAERTEAAARKEQRHRYGSSAAAALQEMRLMEVTASEQLRRRRKPGVVVMLRMLKKLFVVQKTRSMSSNSKSKQQFE